MWPESVSEHDLITWHAYQEKDLLDENPTERTELQGKDWLRGERSSIDPSPPEMLCDRLCAVCTCSS